MRAAFRPKNILVAEDHDAHEYDSAEAKPVPVGEPAAAADTKI